MTIRAAGLADASAIAQLHTLSWRFAYRGILSDDFLREALPENRRALWRDRFAESARPDQIVLVDEEAGAIRGFACAYLEADPEWHCLLDNLHVDPNLKGRGLGRGLMTAIAQRAQRANAGGRLHLWAYEQNFAARRFYERLGGAVTLRQDELAPDGTQVNAVRYCWSELTGLAGHQA